ncbi:hypothetical protein Leryth_024146 [Lithospermum erythrorhizon]|nr:hypothetical protein Leryth_024146 [Lithospermum erythrorhizon]
MVTSIYARGSTISLEELTTMLLNQDACIIHKRQLQFSVNVAALSQNFNKPMNPCSRSYDHSSRSSSNNKNKNYDKFRSKPRAVCQICFEPGHTALKCFQRFNQGVSADSNSSKATLIATPSSIQDPSWYVDSGASNHLTSDLITFHFTMIMEVMIMLW